MDYKKCKEFRKRLKKIGKITAPDKRGESLLSLTKDMRQNGFEFPLLYRCNTTTIMQLVEEYMEKSKIGETRKCKNICSHIKTLGIFLGIVASIITILWFIINFFL